MIRLRDLLRLGAATGALFFTIQATPPASAADFMTDWSTLQMPPPPELKPVTVDPKTTALFLFDFIEGNCSMTTRPISVGMIPTLKAMMDRARAAGMMVLYTLPGDGKIVDQSIAPHAGEVVDQKQGGPDKFLGDDLDQRLKDHGIKTVILCGNSAQGVGIGTGSASAQRGYNVIYPVDCLPSESAFRQAYAAYHMGPGGPPVTTKMVTETRTDMIKFQ